MWNLALERPSPPERLPFLTLLEQLRERRDNARQAAEQILTRAADEQRDLTADELAEHRQQVTAEREAADEADRVRDEQIAELRATTAQRSDPPEPTGPVLTRSRTSGSEHAPAAPKASTSRCRSAEV